MFLHLQGEGKWSDIAERSLLVKRIFSFSKPRLFILCISVVIIAGLVLNEFIQHFEPAHFSLDDLRRQVKRSKRSVPTTSSSHLSDLTTSHQTKAERSRSRYQSPINFNLTAHNRIFQVKFWMYHGCTKDNMEDMDISLGICRPTPQTWKTQKWLNKFKSSSLDIEICDICVHTA